MRFARFMIIAVAISVLALGMLQAEGDQGQAAVTEERPELTLEERLDQSFMAVRAQLRNTGFRLRYTSTGVDKRTMATRNEIRDQKKTKDPVNLNYKRNIERIAVRMGMIRADLGELQERIRAEQNIEGTKAIRRLLASISSFEDAMAMLERASTKDYAEKVLSVAKGALAEMQRAKDELDIACGRQPEGKKPA